MKLNISNNQLITDVGIKLMSQRLNSIEVLSGLVMQGLRYGFKQWLQEWVDGVADESEREQANIRAGH